MLEHEPQQTEPRPLGLQAGAQSSADSERVTAEEFSAAINALEQRKAEEAARLAGTVEIGSTIRDLHIDASPDEVFREVEAQRARRAIAERAAAAARAAAEAAALSEARLRPQVNPGQAFPYTVHARDRRKGIWGSLVSIISVVWVVSWVTGGHIPFVHHGHPGTLGGQSITLSRMADGDTVFTTTDALRSIARDGGVINAADASVPVHTSGSEGGNVWKVIRHNGKLYLDGFTADQNVAELGANPQDIFNDDNSGALFGVPVSHVRVPLKGSTFDTSSTSGDYSQITLEHIPVSGDDFVEDQQE